MNALFMVCATRPMAVPVSHLKSMLQNFHLTVATRLSHSPHPLRSSPQLYT